MSMHHEICRFMLSKGKCHSRRVTGKPCPFAHSPSQFTPRECRFGAKCRKFWVKPQKLRTKACEYWHSEVETKEEYIKRLQLRFGPVRPEPTPLEKQLMELGYKRDEAWAMSQTYKNKFEHILKDEKRLAEHRTSLSPEESDLIARITAMEQTLARWRSDLLEWYLAERETFNQVIDSYNKMLRAEVDELLPLSQRLSPEWKEERKRQREERLREETASTVSTVEALETALENFHLVEGEASPHSDMEDVPGEEKEESDDEEEGVSINLVVTGPYQLCKVGKKQ